MTELIPIFDSNAHPTLSGGWVNGRDNAQFGELISSMGKSIFPMACAVGIDGVEGYEHNDFLAACRKYKNLVPIAGVNPDAVVNAHAEISKLIRMGFAAVKIHPRLSKLQLGTEKVAEIMRACGELSFPVYLCTYCYESGTNAAHNTYDALIKLIVSHEKTPMVLIHGGVFDILKLSELVRFRQNLLLDLSLTMMKYEGSSIDLDIAFLFSKFDRRICVGTDFPEVSHVELRRRFSAFSQGVAPEKVRNIAYANLAAFLKVPLDNFERIAPINTGIGS